MIAAHTADNRITYKAHESRLTPVGFCVFMSVGKLPGFTHLTILLC